MSTCYHRLFVFNQLGDLERCALRPGNVHSADGWRGVLEPVVSRYAGKETRLYFRGDAAFAKQCQSQAALFARQLGLNTSPVDPRLHGSAAEARRRAEETLRTAGDDMDLLAMPGGSLPLRN